MRAADVLGGACVACAMGYAAAGCGLDAGGALQGSVDAGGAGAGGAGGGSAFDGSMAGDQGSPPANCPSPHGPAMVPFGSRGACIDSTEVTNSDYAQFLAVIESTGVPPQPASCAFKTTFAPVDWPPATGTDDMPVVWVDWCDARLYCVWAGKRLCGGFGGGSNPQTSSGDATQSQWFAACSAGGTRVYPYGANYDATACFSQQNQGTSPAAVGTHPDCVGGYPGIYDMSGNAWEWEDSCDANVGWTDHCLIRGGGTSETGPGLTCATNVSVLRTDATGDRGFRCCTP